MKLMKSIAFMCLVFFFHSSCKEPNSKEKADNTVNDIVTETNPLKIHIDGHFNVKDTFKLYVNNFTGTKSLSLVPKKNKNIKRLTFNLPDSLILESFNIDLGEIPDNKESYISRVVIVKKENRLILSDTALNVYFSFNKGLIYNNGKIKFSDRDTSIKNRIITSNENLNNRIINKFSNED